MQWLARVCVSRPVFTWVLMLVILVLGVASYFRLGLDKYPNVEMPTVIVTTRLPGSAPEVMESEVTDKVEAAVSTIGGIEELRSTSSEGASQVIVRFALDKDSDIGAQEVRDKMSSLLGDLPEGIDPPVVSKVDPDSVPVLYLALHGPGKVRDLTELADKVVRRQIENISGVGDVTIVGGTQRQIRVWIDPLQLSARGLTAVDVQRAIARQNFSVPGGIVERGPRQLTLSVDGKLQSLEQLRRLVIRQADGHSIRLQDVAEVEDGAEDATTWASYDGVRAVVLSIRKQSGANTVGVVDAIRGRLSEVERSLPQGHSVEVVRDNSATVRTSVSAVQEHLLVGALLAAAVVFAFLGSGRSTIIAGIAIPVSIVGAFALMYALGFTLNLLTLLALALAVGIVIDDAIVVLENIHRFITVKGYSPREAAILATQDIGLAVLATTLSLLAVFVPIAFMGGIVGRFLGCFGLVMAAAIAISLLVSFTLTPMLCAKWLNSRGEAAHRSKPLGSRFVDALYLPIERAYMVLLRWVMARRWVVVAMCCACLGSCVPLARLTPKSFLPENDDAQFNVSVRAPEGTSVVETRVLADRVAQEIRTIPGVAHTLTTVGEGAQRTANLANIYVKLVEPSERAMSQVALMDFVRAKVLARQPEQLRLKASLVSDFSASSSAIQYSITGPDLRELGSLAKHIVSELRRVPGAVDVDSSFVEGKPESRLAVDRDRAAALGVDPIDVAATVQLLVGGLKVSAFSEHGEDYDIRSRAVRDYRVDERALLITVPSSSGHAVPLDSVTTLEPATGPSNIDRLNRRRQVTISSNVASGVGESGVTAALEEIVTEAHLPPRYTGAFSGNSRESSRTASAFLLAFGASFVFMYLVLAAQFESWLHPVTILLGLPLTVPFALLSLLMFGQQLTMFSALGLLVLFGVVKKNAILQVDHTIQLQASGMTRDEAIFAANRDRLRPIMMTTIAFVAGMLPLLFSRGVGAGLNKGIAGVIVGGQALSLLLTLVATPVIYSLFEDAVLLLKRSRWRGRPAEVLR